MTRIPFICGNWKMNNMIADTVSLIDGIVPRIASLHGVEIGAAPPTTALHAASKRLAGSKLTLAADIGSSLISTEEEWWAAGPSHL